MVCVSLLCDPLFIANIIVLNIYITPPSYLAEYIIHKMFAMKEGSQRNAVFEFVAHEESEIWTSLSYSFTKGGLLQLSG